MENCFYEKPVGQHVAVQPNAQYTTLVARRPVVVRGYGEGEVIISSRGEKLLMLARDVGVKWSLTDSPLLVCPARHLNNKSARKARASDSILSDTSCGFVLA